MSTDPKKTSIDGSSGGGSTPPMSVTSINAVLYVLSGCSQPLIMTLCKEAGLADPKCQLYMLFYYFGPASVTFLLFWEHTPWPSQAPILRACGIAAFDIVAQTLNYTGASLAGPTIFAIVYSSVTVWTALFSRIFLGRSMSALQWVGILTVFGGLTLTAADSLQLGEKVVHGLFLVMFGSAMHALTYVMSEGVMTVGDEKLSTLQNCAVQGSVACVTFFLWQIFYTAPVFAEKILGPMQEAGTTVWHAIGVLGLFFLANVVHSITFFHTLRNFPGGATSAGVMKGLQAVLVFGVTDFVYCGRTGGQEMCFTRAKFMSLITVVGGVILFGVSTQQRQKQGSRPGYARIATHEGIAIEPVVT
jgi:drug/metabolite transporter (DMT)-like permease